MKITIAPEILENYPGTHIGWLYACVVVEEKNDYVEALKKNLPRIVQEHGLFKTEELSKHPRIANWRKIYSDMGVKPSGYRCSLEALLRRVIKGENIWNVSSVVDCYNCVSVMTLLPMGAYDVHKLKGDLTLRYGKEGEIFLPSVQVRKLPSKTPTSCTPTKKRFAVGCGITATAGYAPLRPIQKRRSFRRCSPGIRRT